MTPIYYFVTLTLSVAVFLSRPITIQGQTHVGTTLVDGDIYVHVIAALYTEVNETTGICQGIEAKTVQLLEAIKWIYQELNRVKYIAGVNIGVRVSETCSSIELAKKVALDLSAELAKAETNMRTVGVIGHDFSSESEAISSLFSALPDQFRLLQMSYSATALSLRDREKYPNFFRLIPSDDLQVETLTNLIEAMNYTYMALVYSDDSYGRGLRGLLRDSISFIDFSVPVEIPVSINDIDNMVVLENLLQTQLFDVSPPISGVLVFAPIPTTEKVLAAVRNIIDKTNSPPPVFVFSEANAYIDESFTDVIKGSFVLSPRRKVIRQFEWTERIVNVTRLYSEMGTNKWLGELYRDEFGCELAANLTDNTCEAKQDSDIQAAFPDSPYTQYVIQTALTLAKVIKEANEQTCTGTVRNCSEFLSVPRSMFIQTAETINVQYDNDFGVFEIDEFKNPDLETAFNHSAEVILKTNLPLYEVYGFQNASSSLDQFKIAEFSNNRKFTLDKGSIQYYFDAEVRRAQCPDGYSCVAFTDSSADQSVLYIPGDLYIVGIVPIHEKGTTPLRCGDFKSGSLDIAEAIRFAVKEVSLGASVGVIIIDSCNDPQVIQEKLLTLHRLGIFNGGAYFPVADKIIGYIGGWTSDVSKAIAEITTRLKILQISYASTTTSLSRRSLYKYFLRIPTPDNEQARYMIDLARYHVKTNFVQIIYSESEYGEGGRDNLVERALEANICVTQQIGISDETDISTLVQTLRKQGDAKLVLLFLGSSDVRRVLNTLNNEIEQGEFIIIASEGWGRRYDVSTYSKLVGAITLTSELDINDRFTNAMSELSIETSNVNFWIRPYIEWFFNCYSQWSFNKTSKLSCSDTLALTPSNYRIDVWSAFTERAVIALLGGAKQAMVRYCGNSLTMCEALRNNTQGFYDTVKNQTILENSNNIRIFDDNGDGRAGYRIHVVSNQQGEQYFQIGQINPGSDLFFETNKYVQRGGKILDFTCSGQQKCLECFPVLEAAEDKTDIPIALLIVLVLLGVICCVIGAIHLFICNKYGCCLQIENGKLTIVDYITPIYANKHRTPGDDYNYISDGAVDSVRPNLPQRTENRERNGSQSTSGHETDSDRNNTGSGGSRSGYSGSGGSRPAFAPSQTAVKYDPSDFGVGAASQISLQEASVHTQDPNEVQRPNSDYLNPIK